jgi:hypothetical protein
MIRTLIECVLDRWTNRHPGVRFLMLTAAVALSWICVVKPGCQLIKGWRL